MGSVDLNEVVESVISLVQGECKMRGIEVEKALVDRLPPFRGNHVQLQQVVLNLLLNALDALEAVTPGQRRITLHRVAGLWM